MVLTIPPYKPAYKISDVPPGGIDHPAGSGMVYFELRILTRYGEVIVDFGGFKDLISWYDTLSVEGASGTWTIRMRALLSNEALLKQIHPGMVIEAYCARNDDPLIGVSRDPSKLTRIDTTPELPKYSPATVTPVSVAPAASGAASSVVNSGGIVASNSNMVKALTIIARGESNFDPAIPNQQGSGAQGAFQFMPGSRQRAIELGLGDPTAGGVSQQSQVAEKWLRYTHPDAARLIDSGKILEGLASMPYEWTSVPGGKEESQFWSTPQGKQYLHNVLGGNIAGVPSTPASPAQIAVPQIAPVLGKEVKPVEDAYLDKCPHLLLRGVITDYGRSTSQAGETTLTITGESYGKVYKDSFVLTDLNAPETLSQSLEVRSSTQIPLGVSLIYYRILKEWVESFWGDATGWEARTRPIPFPPNYLTRINNEGAVWSNLQYLAIEGFFHIFVDHTGAIVWEKLPWSSRSQSLIAGRNWEDLQILEMPSWKIINWNDRLSEQGIINFIRCVPTQQGTSGGADPAALPGFIYNQGSIRQYGGPNKREFLFPVGTAVDQYYTSEPRRKQQATTLTFTALTALESIRWYDRPVQRVGVTVRGESAWRIHTRVKIAEDWHDPQAKPAEYYIVSRTHQIDVSQGSWTTSMELVRDRRNRYLGIGVGEVPIVTESVAEAVNKKAVEAKSFEMPDIPSTSTSRFTELQGFKIGQSGVIKSDLKDYAAPNADGKIAIAERSYLRLPLVPDEYYFFDRITGKIVPIGNDPIKWAREKVIPKLGEKSAITLQTPITVNGITAPLGPAAPFTKVDRIYTEYLYDNSPPNAWDFTLERGSSVVTPVPSPISGKITRAEQISGYGNAVEVTGTDGQVWFMAHFDSLAVTKGQIVQRGQTLGNQGRTGHATGEHVHLEIGNQGTRILPRTVAAPLLKEYFRFISGGEPTLTAGF
jgi:hypothetical protein